MADENTKNLLNSSAGARSLLNMQSDSENNSNSGVGQINTDNTKTEKFSASEKQIEAPGNLPVADSEDNFSEQDISQASKVSDHKAATLQTSEIQDGAKTSKKVDFKSGETQQSNANFLDNDNSPRIVSSADIDDKLQKLQHAKENISQALAEKTSNASGGTSVLKFVKSIAPYAVVFVIGLVLYGFYFSDFSINSILNSGSLKLESVATSKQDKALEEIKKDSLKDYNEWMGQFFFDVNDESITAMDTDVSGNGLTNFEKYLLNLNPKVFSTQGSKGDGQLVIEGISPWTGEKFSDDQKALVEKYINTELINNRIAAAVLTRGVTKFAQYVANDSPYYIDPKILEEIAKTDPSMIRGTMPINSEGVNSSNNQTSDVGSGQSGTTNNRGGFGSNTQASTGTGGVINSAKASASTPRSDAINQSVPGRLEVPANKISVPLVWTQDPKNFDQDLKKGIVHYPGTAMPGEIGTAYISGHSSGYLWDKSPYKSVFAILGQVKDGTSFTITATLMNGKTAKYHYVVEKRGEYAANDQAQFISTAESKVALSTCWPVGTTDRRLVLFSRLTQTEVY